MYDDISASEMREIEARRIALATMKKGQSAKESEGMDQWNDTKASTIPAKHEGNPGDDEPLGRPLRRTVSDPAIGPSAVMQLPLAARPVLRRMVQRSNSEPHS